MQKIKIETGNKKPLMVDEPAFLKAMYNYVKGRMDKRRAEIYLEADGEKEFVIIPNNRKNEHV